MRRNLLLFLLCCLPILVAAKGKKTLLATEEGILGDATTLNTTAIQKAVDKLGKQGGGPGRASKGIFYYPLSQIAQVPEKIKSYPEFSMFGELPAWGFYVRHARGIVFRNVRLSLKDEDFRPAFIFDDTLDAELSRVSLPILGSGRPFFARESRFTKNCLETENQTNE